MSLMGECIGTELGAIADGVIRARRAVKCSDAVAARFEECDAAGEEAHGLYWPVETCADGDSFKLVAVGLQQVMSGAAVSLGDALAVDSQGRFVTADSNDVVVGKALAAAGGADVLFDAYVNFSPSSGSEALAALAVAGVAAGYKVARGVAAVTGTLTVVTGLATVVAVNATAQSDLDGDALAGVSATIGDQAGTPAAGSVILKAWKNNADGDATMVAANAAKDLNWIAVGT